MQPYVNSASGIDAYEYGDSWIRVRFKNGGVYEYSSPPILSHHLAKMKEYADSQVGLCTYISTNRWDVYEKHRRI